VVEDLAWIKFQTGVWRRTCLGASSHFPFGTVSESVPLALRMFIREEKGRKRKSTKMEDVGSARVACFGIRRVGAAWIGVRHRVAAAA